MQRSSRQPTYTAGKRSEFLTKVEKPLVSSKLEIRSMCFNTGVSDYVQKQRCTGTATVRVAFKPQGALRGSLDHTPDQS